MRVLILTQDDPFFLAEHLDYLFERVPEGIDICGCVVFEASPFGTKQSFLDKITETWKIFGTRFLMRYGIKYLTHTFNKNKKIEYVLKKHAILSISIDKSINAESSLNKIRSLSPDILVSIAGNEIFKKKLINLAPQGCLNLHTALLPQYRGLMPSFWVLKNEESHTGVSVFFVDEGIDSGPILVQKKIRIGDVTQKQLINITKKVGMEAIIEALMKLKGGNYSLMPNNDKNSTYYSFPTKADVKEFKRRGKKFY